MSEALKPCPFCGGEAIIDINDASPDKENWTFQVGCDTPRCRGHAVTSTHYFTVEEAVEEWNSRTERTCHPVDYRIDIDEGCIASTCSECGELLVNFDFGQNPPKPVGYCQNCGAKVAE